MHQAFAGALDEALDEIHEIQRAARVDGVGDRPRWPMIVLRTPKGWTGPKEVDGLPVEGTWRAHQVPIAKVRGNPEHVHLLSDGFRAIGRKSSSTIAARSSPNWPRLRPRDTGA